MSDNNWINQLFQSIDSKDSDAFLTFLAEDVFFRFGNAEPIHGKNNAGNVVRGFFESIKALQHDISETCSVDDSVICHGFVTYTKHDGSPLTVPFANIFKMEDEKIKEYLIYVDVSELYNTG
ncbi:nuclear transport factor 2 family protein [Kaarinaea lacus]